jgi:hypothetical protein
MDAMLDHKIKLPQIALSVEKLSFALYLMENPKNHDAEDFRDDVIKELDLSILCVKEAQRYLLSPYAKKLDEENLNMAPELKKAVFRQQPPGIDVYFFIDDFKLVFRSSMAGNTPCQARTGSPMRRLRSNSVMIEPDKFHVSAYVEWLDDVGRRLKKIIAKFDVLRNRVRISFKIL